MKKYKLRISVRKNNEEMEIITEEIDTQHFTESIRIRELQVFDKDAYLTFSLTQIDEI